MGFDPIELSDLSEPSAAALAMAIAGLGTLLALWIRAATGKRWNAWWLMAPALVVAGATLLRIALTSGIDSDESEHLHVAYLISHGLMPYRDFDQNHGPFLWMITAPLLKLLPETPYVLYLFRALSLASFAASLAVACSIARRLSPDSALIQPLCIFLALATAVNAEVYRFRPDPFMNLCALASLSLLLRGGANGLRRGREVLLAGLLQGLSVAFSPKLGHLALLAPVVLLYQGRWTAWRGYLLYGTGVALALAPTLLWLASQGLLQDAYEGIVGRNFSSTSRRMVEDLAHHQLDTGADVSSYTSVFEATRLVQLAPIFLLTLLGAAVALRRLAERRATAAWLIAAWALWIFVWGLAPNAATYHIAGALVLGAVFGALALDRLLATPFRVAGAAPMLLGIVLSLCLASTPLRSGVGGWVNGFTYPLARVAWLLDTVRSRGGGCLCLTPWHPIFIATASPLYVSNERGSPRWGEAVEWAMERWPAVVMSRRYYQLAEQGKLSEAQADAMVNFLSQNYRLRNAGTKGFWLLQDGRSR